VPQPADAAPPKSTAPAPFAGPLQDFFAALAALEHGERHDHVRILWLGDSHTNADFLTGAVRSTLAARFGDGGPGFVRVGAKSYRHDAMKIWRVGEWSIDPFPPAKRTVQDDGVFGLGGMRTVPKGGDSFAAKRIGSDTTSPGRFEVAYQLPPGSSFRFELAGHAQLVDASTPAEVTPAGIAHLVREEPLGSYVEIKPAAGSPRFFGLVVERRDKPGIVLDTSGIDGARIETALAWNEACLEQEVSRRAPQLVVIAYGTNEAHDHAKVEKYGPQLGELVTRLRRGAPSASCLVLGPTDAPDGEGSLPRVAEVAKALQAAAAQNGCAFASLQQLMGGEGSFARGSIGKERLSQPDHLHLTPRGYQALGEALSKQLLDAYSAGRGELP
jgi:lysophospholipase L1-like esterase